MSVTPSDVVQQFREQVIALQAQIDLLQSQVHRVEYLYSCESVINNRLIDWCKEQGINPPRSLYTPDL